MYGHHTLILKVKVARKLHREVQEIKALSYLQNADKVFLTPVSNQVALT